MKRSRLILVALAALTSIGASALVAQAEPAEERAARTEPEAEETSATGTTAIQAVEVEAVSGVRVGTFDSRFVALAYYRSDRGGMQAARALEEEIKAATAAKDKERVQELGARGAALQNLMHQQVFGNLSIPNVLATVGDSLQTISANAGVSLLVSRWEIRYKTPEIELVDLTRELVELFDVDEVTTKMIEEGLKKAADPVPIEELLDPHD